MSLDTKIRSLTFDESNFKCWIIGGFIGYSEQLYNEIITTIKDCIKVNHRIKCNVFESYVVKSIVINTETGECYDYLMDCRGNNKKNQNNELISNFIYDNRIK